MKLNLFFVLIALIRQPHVSNITPFCNLNHKKSKKNYFTGFLFPP